MGSELPSLNPVVVELLLPARYFASPLGQEDYFQKTAPRQFKIMINWINLIDYTAETFARENGNRDDKGRQQIRCRIKYRQGRPGNI